MKLTMKNLLKGSKALPLVAGILVGAVAILTWVLVVPREESSPTSRFLPSFIKEARAELEEGDYDFFPNRRSIWVVNRTNGRMANYFFHDDEVGSFDRSRIANINMATFPRKDTVIRLSDRNLNNILWVCNVRTGDVQMWYPARDGNLRADSPISTSTDLVERKPSSATAGDR